MSDNEVFSRSNQDARIHDLEQYTLWTDTPNRPGYRARMSFGERNGAPRISVFTNSTEGPAVLSVGMHPMIFEQFLNEFKELVTSSPRPSKREIENMAIAPNVTLDKNTNRDNAPKVMKNTLVFGKTEEGICWLGIQQQGAPNIAFKISPSVWHHFKRSDGSQVSQGELSCRLTLALIESLRRAMDRWTSRIKLPFVPKERRKDDFQGTDVTSGGATSSASTAASFGADTDINF